MKLMTLNEVDDTTSLLNVRTRASSVLKSLPINYLFTWRDTPVSQKQENIFKVHRCANLISDHPGLFDLVISVEETRERNDSCDQLTSKYKTDQDSSAGKVATTKHSGKIKQGLDIFTLEEIERHDISKLEKERRMFWNNLACEISSHPVYKHWNLQAVVGLIDTEWTMRKSELLKLEANHLLKKINEKDLKDSFKHKTGEKEKKLLQILDRLSRLEHRRKTTYKLIEDLHTQLKRSTTDRHLTEEKIEDQESELDTVFTELKCCLAGLEKFIMYSKKDIYNPDGVNDSASSTMEKPKAPTLTHEELSSITQSVVDDWQIDDLSD